MKRFLSAVTAFLLAISALAVPASAAYEYSIEAFGYFAKPIIEVSMPKMMNFIFNPYSLDIDINVKESTQLDRDGTKSKIICDYTYDDSDAWVVKNNSDIAIKVGTYAYTYKHVSSDFCVCDKNVNTVDGSDDECKYLFLDIKASGGSSGTQSIKLLDEYLRLDTGAEEPPRFKSAAGWWSDENSEVVTVVHDVAKNGGTVNITMDGTTQNVGDLTWTRWDKAVVYFVFSFDAEPTTGS